MNGSQLIRRAALPLLTLGLAVACQSGDIASLESPRSSAADRGVRANPASNGPNGLGNGQGGTPSPVACAPHGMTVNSGVFGPAGGTLVFGNSRLVIPGGALHDTVTISATIPADSSSTVEFQPHGLQFSKPAGLILSGADCSLPEGVVPSVVYLGSAGEVLEVIDAIYDPHWKTAAAPIGHFSGYAIAF